MSVGEMDAMVLLVHKELLTLILFMMIMVHITTIMEEEVVVAAAALALLHPLPLEVVVLLAAGEEKEETEDGAVIVLAMLKEGMEQVENRKPQMVQAIVQVMLEEHTAPRAERVRSMCRQLHQSMSIGQNCLRKRIGLRSTQSLSMPMEEFFHLRPIRQQQH